MSWSISPTPNAKPDSDRVLTRDTGAAADTGMTAVILPGVDMAPYIPSLVANSLTEVSGKLEFLPPKAQHQRVAPGSRQRNVRECLLKKQL